MASIDLIDISSSDSDVEIGDGGATHASAFRGPSNSRVLPQWPGSHGSNSNNQGQTTSGYSWPAQKVPSSSLGYSQNFSSSNGNSQSRMKGPMHHDSNGGNVASSRVVSLDDDSRHLSGNGSMGPSWKVNSRISNGSGTDFEKLSSQQALRRTLPPSIQISGPSTRPNILAEHVTSSRNREPQRSSYSVGVPNVVDRKFYSRDTHGRGSGSELVIHENGGNRILPSSLMQGKPEFSQFVGSSDPMIRTHINEERIGGNDERVIYQEALQSLSQPRVEANLPDGILSISLLRHQKIALYWMLQREKATHCLGGILADDQGLGKTISIIALIQMQRSLQSKFNSEDHCDGKTEALNLDDDDGDIGSGRTDNLKQGEDCEEIKSVPEVGTSTNTPGRRRPKAGTLVVCPASVVRQWARELDDKIAEEAKLSVLIYHGGNRTKDPAELAKYDVVLTTYSIVTNEVPKQPVVDEEESVEKNGEKYGLSSEFAASKKKKKMYNPSKRARKGRKGIDSSFVDPDCGTLAKVGWFRVVLDEAQTIKNHRTQVARACCSLRAKRRWCLSGTPIQNAIDDLYSYFRFLRYDPYADYKSFYMKIKSPISRNSIEGYRKLQTVLKIIMLRRTKATILDGEPIVKLPPKTVCLNRVDFSNEERAFYSQLEADSRSQFKAYAAAGTLSQNYANILLMLLRLRQACDHPFLVRGYYSDSVGKVSLGMAKKLPREMLIDLINRLETSLAICQVCNDPPEDPVVTMCGHVFCYQCVSEYLTGDDNLCPASRCKEHIGADVVFSKATLRSCISNDLDSNPTKSQFSAEEVMQNEYSSSKITAVVEILQSLRTPNNPSSERGFSEVEATSLSAGEASMGNIDSDVCVVKHTTVYPKAPAEAPIKAIIFSQWTSMLDLVEFSLNQYCIQYRRLDGTMTLAARDRAVKEFNTDPEVVVMLMSLKAGNLGLNMVAACHVILLDLWWNPTTEDQAIDRAHRIGQTRPVTVTRLTIKDTVEDRILALQEEKRKMVASAFGDDQGGVSASRLSVEDLRYLFGF